MCLGDVRRGDQKCVVPTTFLYKLQTVKPLGNRGVDEIIILKNFKQDGRYVNEVVLLT